MSNNKFKYLSEDPKQRVQQLAIIIQNCRVYRLELDKDVVAEYNKLMAEGVLNNGHDPIP
tara:strand:+ start:192 stop:371 length:180 start_codon:yes stop_codon:yes gene_type:complete